ncbi:MAG: molybdate transport repressor ModE-like protein [Gammaproteobacteria bacterium]|jgi:molybdate transport repressor ModE-like protein
MEIDFALRWHIRIDGESLLIDELLFDLLEGVRSGGHLNYAAKFTGVSYRHAWGLIRTWETSFKAPLLVSRRGRGATLTKFGEALLQARSETAQSLLATLSQQALRASATVESAIEKDRKLLRIASSHDEKVLRLREKIASEWRHVSIEVVGSEAALRQYRRGDADIAGFHIPVGDLGQTVAAKMIEFLDDSNDEIFLLEKRILGLMSRTDKPCRDFDTLIGKGMRFVNRQAGSATRLTFDGLLVAQGLAPRDVAGYGNEEHTHTAVAALVVSKGADAAFGEQKAAQQFNLVFEPMVEERFYLVVSRQFDSSVRQFVGDYCRALAISGTPNMKADEYVPTVAVMKRVHNAGFGNAN